MRQKEEKWEQLLQVVITNPEALTNIIRHLYAYMGKVVEEVKANRKDIGVEWIAVTLQREILANMVEREHPELSEAVEDLRTKPFNIILDTFVEFEDLANDINNFLSNFKA